jgi:ribonuclease HI
MPHPPTHESSSTASTAVTQSRVVMYTDGACKGNPGVGGYSAILISGAHRKEVSGGFRRTTNNRMELLGVIMGLEALTRPCAVQVCSDSAYICNAMNQGWALKWQLQGWMRNKKERAENPDLWERLLDLCQTHVVEFHWVRGHAGNTENEHADKLAVRAAEQADLPADAYYEQLSPL